MSHERELAKTKHRQQLEPLTERVNAVTQYRIGAHGLVYRWDGKEWVRSTAARSDFNRFTSAFALVKSGGAVFRHQLPAPQAGAPNNNH